MTNRIRDHCMHVNGSWVGSITTTEEYKSPNHAYLSFLCVNHKPCWQGPNLSRQGLETNRQLICHFATKVGSAAVHQITQEDPEIFHGGQVALAHLAPAPWLVQMGPVVFRFRDMGGWSLALITIVLAVGQLLVESPA